MKLIVAVSGGVDSVVLLDMLVRRDKDTLVVAHFDHGIRPDSAEDAEFVGELAASYHLPYETRREELGPGASEELARTRRYAFLREIAQTHGGRIVTAHHMNDIAETVAINVQRGTGWRGLAALDSPDIVRPLLRMTKQELRDYARRRQLTWREDSTNASDAYLRNRLRPKLQDDEVVRQLAALRARQVELKWQIDYEVAALDLASPYSRYFFTNIEPAVAYECLRFATEGLLTRPQMARARVAIATARPGSVYQAGAGVSLHFTSRHFTVQMIK